MSDREKKQIESICVGFVSLNEQERKIVSAFIEGLKIGQYLSNRTDDRAEP